MARNWNSGQQTGLTQIIDAYNQGADRNRGIAKEKADSQRQGQEYAFTHTKNYQKPKTNEYGHVTGYEDNQDTFSRNKPILEKMKPEYFRDPPVAAQPAVPVAQPPQAQPEQKPQPQDYTKAPGQEMSPSGRPMGKTYEDANRSPNGEASAIKPLLRDPKASQQDAQLAHDGMQAEAERKSRGEIEEKRLEGGGKAIVGKGTSAVEYDPNDPGVSMGRDAKGVDQRVVNATKTVQQFDQGANVIGGADASETSFQPGAQRPAGAGAEQAADPNQYNPDAYMMGRITDMATTPTPRASDQMISVSSLPPALLEGTGLEGFKGQIPSSLLKDILSGKTKLDIAKLKGANGGAAALSPEQIPFVQMVDQGTEPGDALAAAAAKGVPISKPFSDALYKSQGGQARQVGQEAAEKGRRETQKRLVSKALGTTVKSTTKQWREANISLLDETNYAEKAKQMANSGNTKGMVGAIRNMLARASSEKGPLSVYDVQQFGGVEGWAERTEQWLNSGANEGLTPENIAIVNRLSDIYIKAAHEKAKFKAKPLLGELRANVRAEFGEEAADDAAKLMEEEMNLTIEYGDSGARDTAPLKDKDGKPVKAMVPAPDGNKLKSVYEKRLEEIKGRKDFNDSQKRIWIDKITKEYKAKGGT